ncbi:hypothetical protein HK104_000726 [Borealophlyctis nickersoniae]|nr:hypothetical protein HK104_000726 [Borealophlyctis nickersoniae]
MSDESSHIYHPKDHGGLKKDGSRDKRVKEDNVTEEKVDTTPTSEEQGGSYRPKDHGGLKKDGTRDSRVKDENVTAEAEEEAED